MDIDVMVDEIVLLAQLLTAEVAEAPE